MGINEAITSEDNWITSYRCHGVEFLRMGSGEAGVKAVINELLGHASGSAHGKGGSMHMYEPDKNFFGGSGIVAAQVPVGTGLGFAEHYYHMLRNRDKPASAAGEDRMNVAVTMFAGGSGNDFIRIFSETEAFKDLERLLDADETVFDLIRCNDDYSLNICSVGLDARIGTDVANYKRLPLLSGFRAYAASTVVNVIRGISEHYVVEVNGERIDGEQTLICACNGRFYGGGFNPVPEADPSDGKLEVLVVRDVSRLKVAQVVGAYKAGKYKDYPHLIRHFSTDRVKILCDKPTCINLDGELRTAQEIHIRVAEEKVRFFYPKGLTWRAVSQKEAALV